MSFRGQRNLQSKGIAWTGSRLGEAERTEEHFLLTAVTMPFTEHLQCASHCALSAAYITSVIPPDSVFIIVSVLSLCAPKLRYFPKVNYLNSKLWSRDLKLYLFILKASILNHSTILAPKFWNTDKADIPDRKNRIRQCIKMGTSRVIKVEEAQPVWVGHSGSRGMRYKVELMEWAGLPLMEVCGVLIC